MGTFSLLAAGIIFVNAGSNHGGDGKNWEHAFNDLQPALEDASKSQTSSEIWIAAGTYTPSQVYSPNEVVGGASGSKRPEMKTFNLPSNITLYGGFAGVETSLKQRDPVKNPTILSGNIGDGIKAWHIVTAGNDIDHTGVVATLDGLTFENGYAAGPDKLSGTALDYSHQSGGGLYARFGSHITLNNDLFRNNSAGLNTNPGLSFAAGAGGLTSGGGGIAAFDQGTHITVTNSTFIDNTAGNNPAFQAQGGAIFIASGNASADISNSIFSKNIAITNGGAIAGALADTVNVSDSIFTTNSTIGRSTSFGGGGAISTFNTNLNINHSIFRDNSSTWTGGAINIAFKEDSPHKVTLTDSIIQNSKSIEGGVTITSMGSANPKDMVTIDRVLFLNNFATANAGALDVDSININVSHSQFIGNISGGISGALNSDFFYGTLTKGPQTKFTVDHSTFIDNVAQGNADNIAAFFGIFSSPAFGASFTAGGGAVGSIWNSDLTISNSLFMGNKVLNGDGGAIITGGAYIWSDKNKFATGASTTLTNNTFIQNSAAGNGGAIASISDFGTSYPAGVPSVIMRQSTLFGNSTVHEGTDIYEKGTKNIFTDEK